MATLGVPKGGYLFLLLFLIFLNHLNKCPKKFKFLLFADDKKTFLPIQSTIDVISVQYDLNKFSV